jgi:hypothetical protein
MLDHVAIADPTVPTEERDAAAARLQTDRQFRLLTRALSVADLTGAKSFPAAANAAQLRPSLAAWLNSPYVTQPSEDAAKALFRGRHISDAWTALPVAFLDPAAGDDVRTATTTVFAGTDVPWHLSALAVDMSRPRRDWSTDEGKETENALAASVDVTLEKAMLADLAAAAPAAVSTFSAAEQAVGTAWTTGADLILCSGADAPKIRRQYAAEDLFEDDRPVIMPTAGATTGTALVLASTALVAEASAPDWWMVDVPNILGNQVSVNRYGLAKSRVAGAVQKVTVA